MKNRLIYIASLFFVFFSFGALAQTKITRVSSYDNIQNKNNRIDQTKAVFEEINQLQMANTVVGKAALPNIYQFESKNLVLNGSGMREIFWLDLYACGLYLPKKNSNAPLIVGTNKPMVIRLDILSNKIDKKKLIKAFRQGFKKSNTEKVVKKFEKEIETFMNFLDVDINIGDKYDIVYTPGVGTTLYVNYYNKGTVKGLGFKAAIFNIWLSEDNPADKSLKKQLLNKPLVSVSKKI